MESEKWATLLFRKWCMIVTSLLLLITHGSHCFYVPHDFQKGDLLEVKMNELTSFVTLVPYPFYSLPYYRPTKMGSSEIHNHSQEEDNGHPVETSPHVFKMREPQECKVLRRIILDAKSTKEIKEKIQYEYFVNMMLDDLPLVYQMPLLDNVESPDWLGFPVGYYGTFAGTNKEVYFIYNHLAFTVNYHRDLETDSARIVGFEVTPLSIKHKYEGKWNNNTRLMTCSSKEEVSYLESSPQEMKEEEEIIFTYDVEFKETNLKWASRWDAYLLMRHRKAQWLSIISSLTIVLLLSGMVAMVMLRTIYCDMSKYDELDSQEEALEKTGWKLVHGDVFRPPSNSDLLCVFIGTGVQISGMIISIVILAIFGILSPSNRGFLITAMLCLYVLMGVVAGYASAQLYKKFKGIKSWKRIALGTALMFPVIVFAIFIVLNSILLSKKCSRAVPYGTIFPLALLLFGISTSLVYVGSFFGFKKPMIEDPVKTNSIPSQIPKRAWYMNPVFSILIGGILPFGAVFNEVVFILVSICLNQRRLSMVVEVFSHLGLLGSLLFPLLFILLLTKPDKRD
ncbi:Nonaspanin (TM9SF) [Corchorus olitorius]|uniref:Transmembrane 9 superfamily member n=1 Tax=Corchorus olitorius TaxID=93759 RepID=A0A1R3J7A2_9ROSI|nr:Nonaspanin (TM9SF) [Corchorus olitorius]